MNKMAWAHLPLDVWITDQQDYHLQQVETQRIKFIDTFYLSVCKMLPNSVFLDIQCSF